MIDRVAMWTPLLQRQALLWIVTIILSVPAALASDGNESLHEPRRVVSLAPHLTELAFEAGIGDLLVGVVAWSDFPPAARDLPIIGDAFRFDREHIVRLGATDALAWAGGTPAAAIEGLRGLGLDVHVIEIDSLDGISGAIETLGELGPQPERAAARAARFRRELGRLRRSSTGVDEPVPIFYQVSARPLFTLGANHVINEVFRLCGARNVFGDLDSAAAGIGIEAVLARDPLAIVAGRNSGGTAEQSDRGQVGRSDGGPGGSGNGEDPLRFWRTREALTAVRCDNLLVVDPALLVRPTPRLLDGARRLCAWLDDEVRRAEDRACRTGRD